jgi:hypothetical protein
MSHLLEAAVSRPFLLNTVQSTRQQVGVRKRQPLAEKWWVKIVYLRMIQLGLSTGFNHNCPEGPLP